MPDHGDHDAAILVITMRGMRSLVWSLTQGEPLRDAFRLAMAASAAALAAQGTALCDPAVALSWRGQVQPQALS